MKSIACLLFLAALAGTATADTLTLQNSSLSANPGDTVTFIATFSNTSGATENLNTDAFFAVPLTVDDSHFLNDWPLSLPSGGSFGPSALFDVSVPFGTLGGPYAGSFTIEGGPGQNDFGVLGAVDFTVNVVPEPGTIALTSLGLALAALRRRRA